MTLQEKNLDAIDTCINTWDDNVKILGTIKASEHCTKISIEYAVEILNKVLKKYKTKNARAIFQAKGKFITIDEVILNEIKQINA